ncbi:MAG: hypothetical protein D6800_01160 [Candidatus Zixiibacteriota bacterium]|nr:MAG: hypothetical protein D6800_01160 [candidate division Zixibacteria bacterium]
MKGKLYSILTAVIITVTPLLCSPAADNNGPARDAAVDSHSEIQKTYRQLSRIVDRWHTAVLRGKTHQAAKLEHSLETVMSADLEAHRRKLRRAARQVALSNPTSATDSSLAAKRGKTFRKLRSLLRTKEHLLRSFQRSRAFSNRYRLAGDYLEILRWQLGSQRTWLAEKSGQQVQP